MSKTISFQDMWKDISPSDICHDKTRNIRRTTYINYEREISLPVLSVTLVDGIQTSRISFTLIECIRHVTEDVVGRDGIEERH